MIIVGTWVELTGLIFTAVLSGKPAPDLLTFMRVNPKGYRVFYVVGVVSPRYSSYKTSFGAKPAVYCVVAR